MAVLLAVIGTALLGAGLAATFGWEVAVMLVGAEMVAGAWFMEGLPAKVMWWRDAKPADRTPRR